MCFCFNILLFYVHQICFCAWFNQCTVVSFCAPTSFWMSAVIDVDVRLYDVVTRNVCDIAIILQIKAVNITCCQLDDDRFDI
jgi:hypothetical protein